ncbi:HD domain-containing protein [Paenibacillus sp. JX-17]|uniref:HD domain-containing protein n=1 Tax=Paenibacillus lacisoli TaxID=3064525 RepID=A0ABT9CDM8_9BACL|nr:HD domain-containing phosphohydrolase [Paenibacillus sp. JX-17]MDO7906683.1 HD domain-containing protein [Paenibacillus sp. JX-17]
MPVFISFIKVLIRNYILGSVLAVMVVGMVFIVSTLEIPELEYLRLMILVLVSLMVMLAFEFVVFLFQLRPLRLFFQDKHASLQDLNRMYIRVHRFPLMSVYRIMGPHLFGFSIPAAWITLWMLKHQMLSFPAYYVGVAALGAILVAAMHALVEFYLTTRAIRPLLMELHAVGRRQFDHELTLNGRVLLSIHRKFQFSATLIGTFPLLLFCLATQIRLEGLNAAESEAYWAWAGVILAMGIGFAYFGGWLLTREVRDPIEQLYSKMGNVENGNLSTRAKDLYSDEFSTLIAGFNMMLDGLRLRESRNRQLLDSYFATLAAALDARDPYTAGHSLRVAAYSVTIGKIYGLSEEGIDLLRKTALLHDIGKIGVPDYVLLKEGKLTDEEFDKIKMHPVLGENILRQIEPADAMAPYLPGVRSHHERYDGRGYPDGLSGEDIPLFGRIIAVADAYDAMTSDRPYRKGMDAERALSILDEGKGTQWDPRFASLFVEHCRNLNKNSDAS